jgi:hypothetical protein
MTCYDNRGGAEVEQFRNDKSGLVHEARRKHSFLGQMGYILLPDLAHSLLADFQYRALGAPVSRGMAQNALCVTCWRSLADWCGGKASWYGSNCYL